MNELRFQRWFEIGMKRQLPLFIEHLDGQTITVGGREVTDNLLYRPHWDALKQALPYSAGTISTIWCNHFLEHLPGDRAIVMLREFERVLVSGGVANIVTPYYRSHLQAQDLDHKSAWNESTWSNLFQNKYYHDFGEWTLRVNACFIAGIVERNLSLFTQLRKL